jgi:hypothetical protein
MDARITRLGVLLGIALSIDPERRSEANPTVPAGVEAAGRTTRSSARGGPKSIDDAAPLTRGYLVFENWDGQPFDLP